MESAQGNLVCFLLFKLSLVRSSHKEGLVGNIPDPERWYVSRLQIGFWIDTCLPWEIYERSKIHDLFPPSCLLSHMANGNCRGFEHWWRLVIAISHFSDPIWIGHIRLTKVCSTVQPKYEVPKTWVEFLTRKFNLSETRISGSFSIVVLSSVHHSGEIFLIKTTVNGLL